MLSITIRLYKLYDYDLIALYESPNFPLRAAFSRCITAWAKGRFVKIKAPDDILYAPQIRKKHYYLQIDIPDEVSEIVADAMLHITDGRKNSFFKNLLRGSLTHPVLGYYADDIAEAGRLSEMSILMETKIKEHKVKPITLQTKKYAANDPMAEALGAVAVEEVRPVKVKEAKEEKPEKVIVPTPEPDEDAISSMLSGMLD